jgi:hypothetical protein
MKKETKDKNKVIVIDNKCECKRKSLQTQRLICNLPTAGFTGVKDV